ncbi:hypothetical protein PM10SUCC1_32510 [Propionigenium maris DSM 9537]|uniref:Uncharacterized protein n=1 Tax=Propionigenium maris DSM 9537 TaxID=1123000 RepID=A0A9W6LPM1_9FUSO|nr:hypothetical protein [Propionigenium maris]GLI57737.1 hypothetical protein PM10SUCC1_32510 [Propionigenium maris DSM 9537]
MKLWECIHYRKLAHHEPSCQKGIPLHLCSGDCGQNMTLGEWREILKKIPYKKKIGDAT